jgi:hypothetical protein
MKETKQHVLGRGEEKERQNGSFIVKTPERETLPGWERDRRWEIAGPTDAELGSHLSNNSLQG